MTKNILLIGRTPSVIDDVISQVQLPNIHLLAGGSTIQDVRTTFGMQPIDHVIVGGGIDLEQRIKIVREVFNSSNSTTVHMNSPSGPESFLPFVKSVLSGIKDL